MEKTFIQWLGHIRKPTEMELWAREMLRKRKCNGCETIIDGCATAGLCTPCFSDQLHQRYKPTFFYVD